MIKHGLLKIANSCVFVRKKSRTTFNPHPQKKYSKYVLGWRVKLLFLIRKQVITVPKYYKGQVNTLSSGIFY